MPELVFEVPMKIVCAGRDAIRMRAAFDKFWRSISQPRMVPTVRDGDTLTVNYTLRWALDGNPKFALQAIAALFAALGPESCAIDMKALRRAQQGLRDVAAALDRIEEIHDRF